MSSGSVLFGSVCSGIEAASVAWYPLGWRAACLAHPAAQQVSAEEVVKAYYDYARGSGNGALPEGRTRSSFVFEPNWRSRPWPPKDKYGPGATDAELGLLA